MKALNVQWRVKKYISSQLDVGSCERKLQLAVATAVTDNINLLL